MERSFTFFFCKICNVCMTYETKKNVPFFYKERKRTQRSERSFEKNGYPTLLLLRTRHTRSKVFIFLNQRDLKYNFFF